VAAPAVLLGGGTVDSNFVAIQPEGPKLHSTHGWDPTVAIAVLTQGQQTEELTAGRNRPQLHKSTKLASKQHPPPVKLRAVEHNLYVKRAKDDICSVASSPVLASHDLLYTLWGGKCDKANAPVHLSAVVPRHVCVLQAAILLKVGPELGVCDGLGDASHEDTSGAGCRRCHIALQQILHSNSKHNNGNPSCSLCCKSIDSVEAKLTLTKMQAQHKSFALPCLLLHTA
jgi:hypothetical protein